ncbi:CheR family methyltransferase [Croceicoccus bisphenolivorans]|uniref:CheR family methyltransferase n=1 Tax=Croceicoccus bisphenolivorans TaxID=1783232 RepID=UPI00082B35C9|nr:CheR family methyltransferase [Croceicoccus bisphenolivorans]
MGTQSSTKGNEPLDFPVVGVGASAGGLEALREMLGGHSGSPGMAFVIVQHLDPNHESLMAQLIERYTSMPVRQIEGGETVEIDNVYVIPPGSGLSVEDGVLRLTEFTDPRGMRRPIDDFFEALAMDLGERAACVILSGTGADGSRGLRAIKEHHGISVAQEPHGARYDGMPLSAVGTGLVDFIRESSEIIPCLREYFDRIANGGEVDPASLVADNIDDLCDALRDQIGHDFTGYKRSTLGRRIERRMQVLGTDDLGGYLTRIRHDPTECQALFRDLLINVTRFFRDDDAFEALTEKVIRPLVRTADETNGIRVWVPGCSSGEEAYSIAILIAEEMAAQKRQLPVQVIASDIDDQMLRIAREGIYPIASIADIPEPMRSKYTVGHGDTFVICAAIREMVRFTLHSVIKDPPFSRIDLISCRNLLIYFDDRLQQAVLPLFHYALRPEAWMFLGPSETIGRYDDLFNTLDARHRIFQRNSAFPSYPLELPSVGKANRTRRPVERASRMREPSWMEGEALRKLTTSYAPPTLLVDREAMIVTTWGPVGRYFDFTADRDRRIHATSLAKPGLREVVGVLVRQAMEGNQRHVARDVVVKTDFGEQLVQVVCDPVRDGTFLIVIRETAPFQPSEGDDFIELAEVDDQVQLLEDELRMTRHRLRSTVEELETANEELKSSNEEMMSMNEELQSTNEELTTVNDELKNKIDQVLVAKSDLENFFDSTQLAVIVVDADMRIRSFTDAACELFPFQPGDRGRVLADVTSHLHSNEFLELARGVARTGNIAESHARNPAAGRDYSLRVLPYHRPDGTVDGATMVFTDITSALTMERELAEQRERLELAIRVARIGVWEYDPATGKTELDEAEKRLLNVSDEDAEEMEAILKHVHEEDRDAVNASLRRAMDGTQDYDQTFRITTDDGRDRWLHGLARRVRIGNDHRFIGVTYDISQEREALAERDLLLREMNHRIKNLFAVVGAMVGICERDASDVSEFAAELKRRIAAMGRAHALTQRRNVDDPITIRELVETVITPARGSQDIAINGPDVMVSVSKLTPLALIFHEWATNAAKYGALASDNGTLTIDISLNGDEATIEWKETTPDHHEVVEAKGFGTRLVQASVRQLDADLDGRETETEFVRRLTLGGVIVGDVIGAVEEA